jgi:hypothetical protein
VASDRSLRRAARAGKRQRPSPLRGDSQAEAYVTVWHAESSMGNLAGVLL